MNNIKHNLPMWLTIWGILGFGWAFNLSIPLTNMFIITLLLFMIPVKKIKDEITERKEVELPRFIQNK